METPNEIMIKKYHLDMLTAKEVDELRKNGKLIIKEIIAYNIRLAI